MLSMWVALFVSLWSAGEYVLGYARQLKVRKIEDNKVISL
jgi:hypothetical protein